MDHDNFGVKPSRILGSKLYLMHKHECMYVQHRHSTLHQGDKWHWWGKSPNGIETACKQRHRRAACKIDTQLEKCWTEMNWNSRTLKQIKHQKPMNQNGIGRSTRTCFTVQKKWGVPSHLESNLEILSVAVVLSIYRIIYTLPVANKECSGFVLNKLNKRLQKIYSPTKQNKINILLNPICVQKNNVQTATSTNGPPQKCIYIYISRTPFSTLLFELHVTSNEHPFSFKGGI